MPVTESESEGRYVLFHTEGKEQSKLKGAFCWLSFLGVWLGSLIIPPVLCLYFIWIKQYIWCVLPIAINIYFLFDKRNPTIKSNFSFYNTYLSRWLHTCSVKFETVLDPAKPTILAFHPHGIFTVGWSLASVLKETRHIYWCFASALYNSGFNHLTRTVLNGAPASKVGMKALMAQGKSLALLPGGFNEASLHSSSMDRIYIKKRSGFIAYALRYGYSVTPVYSFGEKSTYWNVQGAWPFRMWLNSFNLPAILPFGHWLCPILPKDVPVHVVVGQPLQLPKIAKPSRDDVNLHHARYIQAVTELFEKYRNTYYPDTPDAPLEIW